MDKPILNIESIGCIKNTWERPNIIKFYIPSLTFTYQKFFSEHTKVCYIPILFQNEESIRNIFSHYDNLYFKIIYKQNNSYYGGIEHHISDYANIRKLIKKEYYTFENDAYYYIIQFYIKYNGYEITLNYDDYWIKHSEFSREPNRSLHLYLNDYIEFKITNKDNDIAPILKYIKEKDYSMIPKIISAGINENDKLFDTINDAIEYIDNIISEENKIKQEIESCYSKKSYKLIENL